MKRKEISKSVIITGVTQGLGRAMVDRFHELGGTYMVVDVQKIKLKN